MLDNVIPFIGGEEEKSEKEPLKVWGSVEATGSWTPARRRSPASASGCRWPTDTWPPCSSPSRRNPPWKRSSRNGKPGGKAPKLALPSAPRPFLNYFTEDNRPRPARPRRGGRAGRRHGNHHWTASRGPCPDLRRAGISKNRARGKAKRGKCGRDFHGGRQGSSPRHSYGRRIDDS